MLTTASPLTNAAIARLAKRDAALLAIAKRELFLETLDTQRGGVDFQEQAVWCIKAALEAAFQAGKDARDADIAEATAPAKARRRA